MAHSTDLIDPDDLVGYVPRVTTLVSLPLRKTDKRQIVGRNGDTVVCMTATGRDGLPYGKMPRILDAVVATMVITRDESWDADSRRLYVGESFYAFAEHRLGITRGGSQYKRLRDQLGRWMQLAYNVANVSDPNVDLGGAFMTCEAWHVTWLPPGERNMNYEGDEPRCFIQFNPMYLTKILHENPVPISFSVLRALNQQKSPLALDVYLWLNRRIYLVTKKGQPSRVTWEQLRGQFGSDAGTIRKFRQTFKAALAHVVAAWPGLNVEVTESWLALFPSSVSVTPRSSRRPPAVEGKAAPPPVPSFGPVPPAPPRSSGGIRVVDSRGRVSESYVSDVLGRLGPLGGENGAARRHAITCAREGLSPRDAADEWAKGRRRE